MNLVMSDITRNKLGCYMAQQASLNNIPVIEPTQNMAISDIQAARCESFTISEGGRNE